MVNYNCNPVYDEYLISSTELQCSELEVTVCTQKGFLYGGSPIIGMVSSMKTVCLLQIFILCLWGFFVSFLSSLNKNSSYLYFSQRFVAIWQHLQGHIIIMEFNTLFKKLKLYYYYCYWQTLYFKKTNWKTYKTLKTLKLHLS